MSVGHTTIPSQQSTSHINYRAYSQAQETLKNNEDIPFSDEEIDAFLPEELQMIPKHS
jgi:hypothetical protein